MTGSGKTEVYLEAVAETLRQRRQALVLLPEIALTTEFLTRIEAVPTSVGPIQEGKRIDKYPYKFIILARPFLTMVWWKDSFHFF